MAVGAWVAVGGGLGWLAIYARSWRSVVVVALCGVLLSGTAGRVAPRGLHELKVAGRSISGFPAGAVRLGTRPSASLTRAAKDLAGYG